MFLKDKWLFFPNLYVCNDGILFARSFKLVNFVNKPLLKNKDKGLKTTIARTSIAAF